MSKEKRRKSRYELFAGELIILLEQVQPDTAVRVHFWNKKNRPWSKIENCSSEVSGPHAGAVILYCQDETT